MRWLNRFGAWLFVLSLLAISLVEGSCIQSQLRRDRVCVNKLHGSAARIEAFRSQNGRLPKSNELGRLGLSVIDYRVQSAGGGATAAPEHFVVKDWRGARMVQYDSATGRDTCGSGAWLAAACLAVVMLPLWVLALLWLRRSRRRRDEPAQLVL